MNKEMELDGLGIACAVSFALEDDYTRMSSVSTSSSHVTSFSDESTTGTGQYSQNEESIGASLYGHSEESAGAGAYGHEKDQCQVYPSHSQVVDVLLHNSSPSSSSDHVIYNFSSSSSNHSEHSQYYSISPEHHHDQHFHDQASWFPVYPPQTEPSHEVPTHFQVSVAITNKYYLNIYP